MSQMTLEERQKIEKQIDGILNTITLLKEKTPTLKRFLELSAGRVLLKNHEKLNDTNLTNTIGEVSHIADWLIAAIKNNDDWITNVDDKGRPKKLMKFSSLEQIMQEADKAMLIASQKLKQKLSHLSKEDEKLIMELNDGYYIVQLFSSEALDRESAYMQHCIGNGAYDDILRLNPDRHFVSLRDPFGKPHVTIDYEDMQDGTFVILELQGKQNKSPVDKYMKLIGPFLASKRFDFEFCINDFFTSNVLDDKGVFHRVNNLPDGLKAMSPLKLQSFAADEFKLPEDFYAQSLSVTRCSGMENIKYIDGNAYFDSCDNIKITSDMHLNNVEFTNCNNIIIEDGVIINGSLEIDQCNNVSIPENLIIRGNLSLQEMPENSGITELSKGLKVGGGLALFNTEVNTLYDNMSNLLHFYSKKTPLTYMPDKITVKDRLSISGATIEKGLMEIVSLDNSFVNISSSTLSVLPFFAEGAIIKSEVETIPENYNCSHLTVTDTTFKNTPEHFYANTLVFKNSKSTIIPALAENVHVKFKMSYSDNLNNNDNIDFVDTNYELGSLSISTYHNVEKMDAEYLKLPESIADNIKLKLSYSRGQNINTNRDDIVMTVGRYRQIQEEKNTTSFSM